MEEPQFHFRIHSIQVLKFSQRETKQPIVPGGDHAVNISMGVQANKDNNMIRVILDAAICESDATSPTLVEIKTAMGFQFKKGELFDADPNIEIPRAVLDQLASVTYSTTRGVLYAKVGLSPLANLVLPLLDIRQITDQIKLIDKDESKDVSG